MGTSQSSTFSPQSSTVRSKLAETQVLMPYQKVILRATWRHMSKSGQSSCGNTIMRRMFIRNDRIKNIFHHMTLLNVMLKTDEAYGVERHYKEIVGFLQFVISNLDYPSKIMEKCHEIGVLHQKYKTMGMKTEHWDLLGEAITETIREYQGWKRHRESLRAANILVSFLIDRIRAGFLQRGIPTPTGTPPKPIRCAKEVPYDRGRSKSLQEPYHGLYRHVWADSCPSIDDHSATPILHHPRDVTKPKRSLPCISTSRGIPLEMPIFHRKRWLPQTPSLKADLDSNRSNLTERKRQQFRSSTHYSVELGHFNK